MPSAVRADNKATVCIKFKTHDLYSHFLHRMLTVFCCKFVKFTLL